MRMNKLEIIPFFQSHIRLPITAIYGGKQSQRSHCEENGDSTRDNTARCNKLLTTLFWVRRFIRLSSS